MNPAEVSAAFAAAINAGDLEAALGLWREEAVLIGPGELEFRGGDSIRPVLLSLIDSGTQVEIALERVVCAAEIALGWGTWTLRQPGTEAQHGSSVVVYARAGAGGQWRLAIDSPFRSAAGA